MYGPWYTLNEASKILGILRSDLIHIIESKNLTPVTFTSERPLLLLSRGEDGHWVGQASCRYRGHLQMHPNEIQQLTDGKPVSVKSTMAILETKGVSKWNPNYPFKKSMPIPPLAAWHPTDIHPDTVKSLYAIPFPRESIPVNSALHRMTNSIQKMLAEDNPAKKYDFEPSFKEEDTRLLFDQNNLFHPEDIRIPKSEIELYLSGSADKTTKKSNDASDEKENQLHTLLSRIVNKNPQIKSKEAWSILEHDYDADEPEFDTDGIIRSITPTEIEWVSRHGNTNYLKFSSFAPTLSKIRRKHT